MSFPRFGLGARIYLLTALLVVAVVGGAVVGVGRLGRVEARSATTESLSRSSSTQAALRRQRSGEVQLMVRQLGSDPGLRARLAGEAEAGEGEAGEDSAGGEDGPETLSELLEARRRELGLDFALVVDPTGRPLARGGKSGGRDAEVAASALVVEALRRGEARGIWPEGKLLAHAAGLRLVEGPAVLGAVVAGLEVDDLLALEVKRISGPDVVFLAAGRRGPEIRASTLGAAAGLAPELAPGGRLRRALEGGEGAEQIELRLGGERWLALGVPLRDTAGRPVAAAVSLAPLERERAPYRRIQALLGLLGAAALLAALPASFFVARRATKPLRRLTAAVQGARRGEGGAGGDLGGRGTGGELGGQLGRLLEEVEGGRELAAWTGEAARTLPEPAAGDPPRGPESGEMALLALELRRFAHRRVVEDPGGTAAAFARDLGRIEAAVRAGGGRVAAVLGHRVLAGFEGDGRNRRALTAAAALLPALGSPESAFEEAEPPAAVLVTGTTVAGSAAAGGRLQGSLLGLPVQQLELLLREASPGDLLLSKEAHGEVERALQEAGLELGPQRGLFTQQTVFVLRGGQLAELGAAAPRRPAAVWLGPGEVVDGRFQILSPLGAGGEPGLYKARDRDLDDVVALGTVASGALGEDRWEQISSELMLARAIGHPNVLRILDFGRVEGLVYVAMEYVRGLSLRFLLEARGAGLPLKAGLHLARQLAAGLAAAHAAGSVHRDLGAGSVLVAGDGTAKIMGFGLPVVGPERRPLAPEEGAGGVADPRTDVYLWGALIQEVFAGAVPGGEPAGRIPERLVGILARCLEEDPAMRFPSAVELSRQLEAAP